MNDVNLTGRLTKDPDVRTTASGATITKFTLAVSRWKKDDGADFIPCLAWGKTAEIMGQYLKKGSLIGVSGHIQTGSYEKDGARHYTTDVVVERFDFLERPNGSTE